MNRRRTYFWTALIAVIVVLAVVYLLTLPK